MESIDSEQMNSDRSSKPEENTSETTETHMQESQDFARPSTAGEEKRETMIEPENEESEFKDGHLVPQDEGQNQLAQVQERKPFLIHKDEAASLEYVFQKYRDSTGNLPRARLDMVFRDMDLCLFQDEMKECLSCFPDTHITLAQLESWWMS